MAVRKTVSRVGERCHLLFEAGDSRQRLRLQSDFVEIVFEAATGKDEDAGALIRILIICNLSFVSCHLRPLRDVPQRDDAEGLK